MRKTTALICAMALGIPGGATSIAQDVSPDKGAVIRTSTQEVVLELTVRDRKGKIVKNLQQNDIEIYEDGVKQSVRSFRLVQGRDAIAEERAAPGAMAKTTVTKAGGNALHAVNLVCIVFHNLDPNTKKYAVEAAQEFIENDMTADTWVAIFNLSSRLTVLHPFTTNKKELLEAAKNAYTSTTVDFVRVADAILSAAPNMVSIEEQVNGNPAAGGSVSTSIQVTGGELNQRVIGDATVDVTPAANAQRGDLVGQRLAFGAIEGEREADSVLAMIQRFGTLAGRKSVLFMSPGMPTTGDVDLFNMIVEKALKADVTVYAVDVNGLTQNANQLAGDAQVGYAAKLSSTQANNATGAAMREKMRQDDYIGGAVRTSDTQASLRGFAEGTGGFLIGNTNDLKKPFQKIAEDVETHYEASYSPSDKTYNGKLRTIEVKLASNRSDLSVSSRTGYFAMPYLGGNQELSVSDSLGLAALNVRTPPHAFPFEAAALQFKPGPAASLDAIAVEVPASVLTFTPEPLKKIYKVHVSTLALIKDSSGQVVEKFGEDTPYDIPEQNLPAVKNLTINFTHPVNLPPGHYTMDTAVVDQESSRAAIKTISFDSPESKGVGLSSVMLIQRLEPAKEKADPANPFEVQAEPSRAYKMVPELEPTLTAAARPRLYFVIYPDKSIAAKPSIQVEFLVNGQLVARSKPQLPAPDATGAIAVPMPAPLGVGENEFRVTAFQGDSVTQKSAFYKVAGATPGKS